MRKIPMWRRHDRIFGPDPRADIKAELRFHIECKTEDLIAHGWLPEAARTEAERQFGNILAVKQAGERIGEHMDRRRRLHEYYAEWVQDARYTLRTLRNNPAFATIAILVLALGAGLNAAVFSVVNTMLLRPLPFPQSHQLVWFTAGKSFDAKVRAAGGLSADTYTVDVVREFQRNNRSFQDVTSFQTFYNSLQYKLTGVGEPRQLDAVEVAGNFFPTLGVTPVLGRNFSEEETLKGGRSAALLSYYFWKTQFGSDPNIIGKTIDINTSPSAVNGPVTIVGVLPASFDFGAVFAPGKKVDLFVPVVMDFWKSWGNTLAVVGRLKPGITPAQAQDEADRLFPQLKLQNKDWYYDYASDLTTLKDHVAGKLRRSLVVLWSAVGLILLIVSVNLSNLQLSRAAARSKEFAMRRALGARRIRIVRQLLTESLILSFFGAVVGFGIAWAIVYYLAHQNAIALPLLTTIHLDTAALTWTLVIAIAVGILFGLAPALRISGTNVQEVIKDNASGLAAGRSHERFRSVLVISELALACLLLVGAGLLLRSFLRVLDVDLGFNPSHAAAMQTDLPPAANKDQLVKRANFLKSEIDRVAALPGVQSVGIADMLPLDRNREWGLESVGRYHAKDADTGALVYLVTPGYLQAMGMRLREGRDFSWNDTPDNAASDHRQRSGRTARMAGGGPNRKTRQRRGRQACPCHRCSRRCPGKHARTELEPGDLRSHDPELRCRGRNSDRSISHGSQGSGGQRPDDSAQSQPLATGDGLSSAAVAGGSLRVASPLFGAARDDLRHPRRPAGRARHLRSHLLLRYAKDTGDWSAHGSWGHCGPRPARRTREDLASCDGRHRPGNHRVSRSSAPHRFAALRHIPLGSDRFRCYGCVADSHSSPQRLFPRSPCLQNSTDGCSA